MQTLSLFHGEDSTRTACILLEPNQIGADRVENHVETLASEEGVDLEKRYFTDFSPEMIIERYLTIFVNYFHGLDNFQHFKTGTWLVLHVLIFEAANIHQRQNGMQDFQHMTHSLLYSASSSTVPPCPLHPKKNKT